MFGGKHAEGPTVVGEGSVIVGTLSARGRVQIDGVVECSVKAQGQVSVGPKGRVEGDLIADDVAVGGEIKGRVVARGHLHVVASGRVRGDMHYGTLQVERGAVLDGRTLQGEPAEPVTEGAPEDTGSHTSDAAELAQPVLLRPSQRPQAAAS
jgi:cytoskeletal protein CcmA (bactofilin family)